MEGQIESPLLKIVSGAQTGADIAALRVAKELGFQTGGWMPKGYKTLVGRRPSYVEQFDIKQHDSGKYRDRTYRNVYDSDATLRLAHNFQSPGEICTAKAVAHYGRISMDVQFTLNAYEDGAIADIQPDGVCVWLRFYKIQVLNVAGNSGEWFEPIVEDYFRQVLESYMKRRRHLQLVEE